MEAATEGTSSGLGGERDEELVVSTELTVETVLGSVDAGGKWLGVGMCLTDGKERLSK